MLFPTCVQNLKPFLVSFRFRLKDLDVEFLQLLCTKVNVIPVIAKADTLVPDEAALFKKSVREGVFDVLPGSTCC